MSKKMMKRSLALGALMAFVITGSAMAAEDTIAKGVATTITSGDYDKVVGGIYLKNDGTSNNTVKIETTNIVFENGTAVEVLGGSRFNQVLDTKSEIVSTNVTIVDGKFGENPSGGDNVPAALVVGGDNLKSNDTHGDYANNFKVESSIETTNLEIQGGTFNALVLGGSSVIKFYGDGSDANEYLKSQVGTANTVISGGTFTNHIIAAGGMAWGSTAKSVVDNAIVNISESTIGVDIYAGGITDKGNGGQATVTNGTMMNLVNSKVNNIYGCNAIIYQEAGGQPWKYEADSDVLTNTILTLTNVEAETVNVQKGTVTLSATDDGETKIKTLTTGSDVKVAMVAENADAFNGDAKAFRDKIIITNAYDKYEKVEGKMNAGEIVGDVTFKLDKDGNIIEDSIVENVHEGNASVTHMANVALMSWRAETNDMNKRMGELRNANGEYGVWARMVGGEDEYKNATYEYNQYQLGYDEKLSVDPSWTVGVALSYTDGESNFGYGSGENTHKGLSVYGSKLNDDGSFIDLIAKYSRLEHELTIDGDKGDYSTNGYSVSAEYGKRIQQGNGLWVEPQVELTYGKVKSAEYQLGQKTVSQDAMESLVGRIGFSLGKNIEKGNVYARASYLYDFEGETNVEFANGVSRNFAYDLGGGWWEVGVGANINLSKATYIYADVEKTFGGEVDTNWQWNLGVRYSF